MDYLNDPDTVAMLAAARAGNGTAAGGTVGRLDGVNLDAVANAAAAHALQGLSMEAATTVQAWVETDDLGDGEGAADRLIAMLVGIADENKDGELDDEENAIVEMAAGEAWSYMAAKGVADSDLEVLFGEDGEAANAAGERIMEFLRDSLPDGAEMAADEVDNFAFGDDAQEGVFDSTGAVRLDAVYKKRFAIRGGKKMMVRKRVAGTVRLSAKQKVAIRKARMKSNSSKARMKRAKSVRVRKSMGLNR